MRADTEGNDHKQGQEQPHAPQSDQEVETASQPDATDPAPVSRLIGGQQSLGLGGPGRGGEPEW